MNRRVLEVTNLTTCLDGEEREVRAVDDVSFAVDRGETYALLGESGCGKSMTALSLMRLLPEVGRIVAGSVRLGDRDLLLEPETKMREVRGRDMAMIFQEPATSLNPVLTVGDQICEVLARHRGLAPDAARVRAAELLEAAGIGDAEHRLEVFPFQMSGGMKQRVMIAMALAGEPDLLIADEPTTALDVTIQAQVLDLLARLQQERGMAVLLITHDLGVVARMAQRIGVMYAGQLIEEASRACFFATPRHPYSQRLFAALPSAQRRGVGLETIPGTVPPLTRHFAGCRFAERCAHAWERCGREVPSWHLIGENHRVRCHLHDAASGRLAPPVAGRAGAATSAVAAQPSVPLLEVRGLQVHFPVRRGVLRRIQGHLKAVDGIDLRLDSGRTLALVGESGCGKTTVGKAILRLLRPSSGSVSFQGQDVAGLSRRALRPLRRSMQMVFQDPYSSLDPRMRVGEIIAEGMSALALARPADGRDTIGGLLEQVGLDASMVSRFPHEFSGGQRQRIAIARALAVSPQLLICDEPTSALDVSVQAQILNLLKDLQAKLELAYLFITHNLAVVDYLADDVAVMYLGRIVECGPAGELLDAPRHPYTAALLAAVPRVEQDAPAAAPPLGGDLPSPLNPPAGCHFHPRCPQAMAVCRTVFPAPTSLSQGHTVCCHLYGGTAGEISPPTESRT